MIASFLHLKSFNCGLVLFCCWNWVFSQEVGVISPHVWVLKINLDCISSLFLGGRPRVGMRRRRHDGRHFFFCLTNCWNLHGAGEKCQFYICTPLWPIPNITKEAHPSVPHFSPQLWADCWVLQNGVPPPAFNHTHFLRKLLYNTQVNDFQPLETTIILSRKQHHTSPHKYFFFKKKQNTTCTFWNNFLIRLRFYRKWCIKLKCFLK